jgi:menaquinone-dependent protoporphyrinogen oxidase
MVTRVLVAYASKMGSTREIAESIVATLEATGLSATAVQAAAVRSLDGYDAVVLGSALYAAHWQRDANRFVTRNVEALRARPVWLFSSGPLDRRLAAANLPIAPNAQEITARINPRGHRTFGGRLDADSPGVDPQILQTHPLGDFRDWDAIRAWAMSIAEALLSEGDWPDDVPAVQ